MAPFRHIYFPWNLLIYCWIMGGFICLRCFLCDWPLHRISHSCLAIKYLTGAILDLAPAYFDVPVYFFGSLWFLWCPVMFMYFLRHQTCKGTLITYDFPVFPQMPCAVLHLQWLTLETFHFPWHPLNYSMASGGFLRLPCVFTDSVILAMQSKSFLEPFWTVFLPILMCLCASLVPCDSSDVLLCSCRSSDCSFAHASLITYDFPWLPQMSCAAFHLPCSPWKRITSREIHWCLIWFHVVSYDFLAFCMIDILTDSAILVLQWKSLLEPFWTVHLPVLMCLCTSLVLCDFDVLLCSCVSWDASFSHASLIAYDFPWLPQMSCAVFHLQCSPWKQATSREIHWLLIWFHVVSYDILAFCMIDILTDSAILVLQWKSLLEPFWTVHLPVVMCLCSSLVLCDSFDVLLCSCVSWDASFSLQDKACWVCQDVNHTKRKEVIGNHMKPNKSDC